MNSKNKQQKKIGDRVMITGGPYRDQIGTLSAKERRSWVVELDDGIQVKVTFPMVVLIEADHNENAMNQTSEATTQDELDTMGNSTEIKDMTVKQLQELAKQRGIGIARTKSDFLRIIKAKSPDEDLDQLTGKTLFNRVSELHISRLRSKAEIVSLLSQ